MEYLIGVVLALTVAGFATIVGFDRERAFYSTVLIVVASYYVLFAAMGASGRTVIIESSLALPFLVAALLGFKKSSWFLVAGLVGHGVFDFFFHHAIVKNPGMPRWWPGFCGAYDVIAGAWLAVRLMMSSRIPAAK